MNGEPADRQRFYDAYVGEHGRFQPNPPRWKAAILRWLPYASYREWRFWHAHLPRCRRLLDVGCARGRELFMERSDVVCGVDLALPALRECAYPLAAQAWTDSLPFADGVFDCVVSSHVLGHIPAAAKPATMAELARVLRPGGCSLHVLETDARRPWIETAKRWPALYERYFVEPDGHVGLELGAAALERFEAVGFTVEHVVRLDAGPWLPRVVLKHFDNELADRDPRLGRAVRWARRLQSNSLLLAVTDFLLGCHHWTFGQRAAVDQAPYLAVVARKPLATSESNAGR